MKHGTARWVALSAGAAFLFAGSTVAVGSDRAVGSDGVAFAGDQVAIAQLRDQAPGVRFLTLDESIRRVFGPNLSTGVDAVASASSFLTNYASVFGVSAGDLIPWSLSDNGSNVTPLMPDDDGNLKFNLVTYAQTFQGIPVFRADVRLLTRNTAANDLVWVGNALRPITNFAVDPAVMNAPALNAAVADAELRFPGLVGGTITPPQLTIWAGVEGSKEPARLAVFFTATTAAGPADAGYGKWIIVADAATGRMIWSESQIHQADVSGRVSGISTTGLKSAECNAEADLGLPYATVTSGAISAFADASGNYTLTGVPAGAVTVNTSPRGRYFRTYNPSLDVPVTGVSGSGTVNVQLNTANTDQTVRGGVNAYIQANAIRDLIVTSSPAYPVIAGQTSFRINVAVAGTCNAFYDGGSINFYNSGGGCANTAYYDVVHHEYGHHVVSSGGSGQGQYGEGTGDCMGVLMGDQPILGFGFQNNCNAGIRTANNTYQYPQDPNVVEVHDGGQLISGCVWSTRNALVAAGVPNYRSLLARLCINAVPLHSGSTIAPDITVDWLTLDDNDGNINNGTPHYAQINAGFTAHNMDGPAIQLIDFEFPDGLPTTLTPGVATSIRVDVVPLFGTPQDNSGQATFRIGAGADTTAAMTRIGVNQYVATIPAQSCATTVTYSFSARSSTGVTQVIPANAPAKGFRSYVSYSEALKFADNFETNLGWAVTNVALADGPWGRGIPVEETDGTRFAAVPAADFDGSGQCFLTDNVAGNSDVDGGTTTLTSPVMDASGGTAFINYARWYSNHVGAEPQADVFTVEISGNNGTSWVNLETVGPAGAQAQGGWYERTIAVPSAQSTSQFRVRFVASDLAGGSVVEAAVDGVNLLVFDCNPPSCPADFNGDGFVDFFDYDGFVSCFETGACPPGKSADFNGDGFTDFFDYDDYVLAYEIGC